MRAATAAVIAAALAAAMLLAACAGSRGAAMGAARGAEGFQQKCPKNQEWLPTYGCYPKCPPGSTRIILDRGSNKGKPGACWSDAPLPTPPPHKKPPPRAPPPPRDWVVEMKSHGLYEQARRNDANAIVDMAMGAHGDAEGFDRRRLRKYIDYLAMNRRLNGAQFMYDWMQSKGNRDHIKRQREYTHARI